MAITFHFREKLLDPEWANARGFVVGELDYLFTGLAPLSPLSDGLQTLAFAQTGAYPANAILTTNSAGTPAFTSGLPAPLQFQPNQIVTPPTLPAGNINDYTPAGFSDAAQVRLLGGIGTVLTGMAAPTTVMSGLYKLLINLGTSQPISLAHQSGLSKAGNRFNCPGGVAYSLTVSTAVWVWFDPVAWQWQIIGK